MNSAEILDEFRCALSDDNHFLINPIPYLNVDILFARIVYQMKQKFSQLNVKNVG